MMLCLDSAGIVVAWHGSFIAVAIGQHLHWMHPLPLRTCELRSHATLHRAADAFGPLAIVQCFPAWQGPWDHSGLLKGFCEGPAPLIGIYLPDRRPTDACKVVIGCNILPRLDAPLELGGLP